MHCIQHVTINYRFQFLSPLTLKKKYFKKKSILIYCAFSALTLKHSINHMEYTQLFQGRKMKPSILLNLVILSIPLDQCKSN